DGDVAVSDGPGSHGASPDAHAAVFDDAAPRGPMSGAHATAPATRSVGVYAGPSPAVAAPATERARRSPLLAAEPPTSQPPAPPSQPPRAGCMSAVPRAARPIRSGTTGSTRAPSGGRCTCERDIRRIMSAKTFRISIEAVLWIAVLGFVGYRIWPQAASALGIGSGGLDAPDFRVETLDGTPVALSDLRGQVVLVNFWATWCPPCRFEMPGFQRVYDEYRDQGFTILGLSTDRGGTRIVREFLEERGITYPVAMATPE